MRDFVRAAAAIVGLIIAYAAVMATLAHSAEWWIR